MHSIKTWNNILYLDKRYDGNKNMYLIINEIDCFE
jgi:hypothetical protein